MKRIGLLLVLVVLFSGFVLAEEGPDTGIGAESSKDDPAGPDFERIEGLIDELPFDDSGDVNFSKYKPFRSKAEERIEAVNRYVGPITRVLWGVELTLSWVFVFAFIMWILLIELIIVPVSSIFDWEIWWTLLGSAIIATLAMQGFGKDFVVWMESLMTQWWVGFVVLVGAVVVGIVYSVFFKFVKAHADKAREKEAKDKTWQDRKVLAVEAKLAKDSF